MTSCTRADVLPLRLRGMRSWRISCNVLLCLLLITLCLLLVIRACAASSSSVLRWVWSWVSPACL